MEVNDDRELEYEIKTKKYLRSKFDHETMMKGITALNDLRAQNKSYEFCYTALTKKAPSAFIEHGFGLFFNQAYQKSVERSVLRNRESLNNDELEYYSILDDPEMQYVFPQD